MSSSSNEFARSKKRPGVINGQGPWRGGRSFSNGGERYRAWLTSAASNCAGVPVTPAAAAICSLIASALEVSFWLLRSLISLRLPLVLPLLPRASLLQGPSEASWPRLQPEPRGHGAAAQVTHRPESYCVGNLLSIMLLHGEASARMAAA